MRRKDKELTDSKEIDEIVKKATVCRLGLVDGDEAYIVPVNFGYERNAIYFHSALEGRKIELLKRNDKICFEIETDVGIGKNDKSECKVKYRSVIGMGRARILESAEEKVRGLKAIMRQCAGGEYSFLEERLDTVLVVEIRIENVTGKQSGF
jgi:nitroimidazol reductase NimA-like FMN-containing flavoprotein (pyridoxamine 5'-phosphate oxidase superfamily)